MIRMIAAGKRERGWKPVTIPVKSQGHVRPRFEWLIGDDTLPIPLLPLWTVRPVQSLGACTGVHFTLLNLLLFIFG